MPPALPSRSWPPSAARAASAAALVGLVACEGGRGPAGGLDAGTAGAVDASTRVDGGPMADPDSGTPDAGARQDAGTPRDAGADPSRCRVATELAECDHETLELPVGDLVTRQVHFQTPADPAPAGGWPVVVFFQGSFFSSGRTWSAEPGAGFGAYALVRTFAALLDAGYAVVAPEAHVGGNTFWDTNVPPFTVAWEASGDHRLMLELVDAIEAGRPPTL